MLSVGSPNPGKYATIKLAETGGNSNWRSSTAQTTR